MACKSSSGIDGVSVRHYPDNPNHVAKPYLARAKDATGRWKGKWFTTEDAATRWASSLSKDFAKGASAGTVRMSVIGPDYVAYMRREGRKEDSIRRVDHIWRWVVRQGLDNLVSPQFPPRFAAAVAKLEFDWWVTDAQRQAPVTGDRAGQLAKALHEDNQGRLASKVKRNELVSITRSIIDKMAVRVSPKLLVFNPLEHMELQGKSNSTTMRQCFTVEELKLMVGDAMQDHPYYIPACLAVYNPRRTSEAMHLRWEWINWESMSVKLVNTPELARLGISFKSGETSWPLEPELKAILRPIAKPHGWVVADDRLRAGAGWASDDYPGHQRRKIKGERLSRVKYTKPFKQYFKQCGITIGTRVPYCLRHTGITIRLGMGMQEHMVAAYAAHADSKVTLRNYGRERAQFSYRVKHWGDRFYLRDAEPQPLAVAR